MFVHDHDHETIAYACLLGGDQNLLCQSCLIIRELPIAFSHKVNIQHESFAAIEGGDAIKDATTEWTSKVRHYLHRRHGTSRGKYVHHQQGKRNRVKTMTAAFQVNNMIKNSSNKTLKQFQMSDEIAASLDPFQWPSFNMAPEYLTSDVFFIGVPSLNLGCAR